ncbi:DoxX family protein [Halobacillus shinanisalinarum]|uniref:DoxX family protein n=1 Tax=Halobacillus shinanisalinarum TaxID=2932258 RepID=A0ABY4H578_9BACI|nr:DoxX family protein [Halobacillus shinanisalinarum]UOQ95464.1 DoxX family protein [Halobacillus shinanisalinarum]
MNTSLSPIKLIRYVTAFVFITSGVMKVAGSGLGEYFANLGIPNSITIMYVVAAIEIACGILLVANRYVKYATIPLIGIIIAALLITKVPTLHAGYILFLFEARLDIVMLGLLFILYNQYPRRSL